MSEHEEFYVGYLERAPGELGRTTRRRILGLLICVSGLALLWAAGHSASPGGAFEFGVSRKIEGTLLTEPYPTLVVARPGDRGDQPAFSRYPLVEFGKMGASEEARALNGRAVTAEGTLIFREGQTMLELAAPPLARDVSGVTTGAPRFVGQFALQGEIVDSKCYLGVMNPGSLKTHKSCAIRCIDGGIPPALIVRDEDGRAITLLLAADDGGPVPPSAVRDLVAEPVEISGRVFAMDDLLVLYADPSSYRLLGAEDMAASAAQEPQ